MVTIKSYTDIEQSKKLAEILPLESADYFHAPDAGVVVTEPYQLSEGDETVITAYKGAIPCWSLAALLNILPNYHVTNNGITGVVVWSLDTYSKEHDNPVDACYEMILKLNELEIL